MGQVTSRLLETHTGANTSHRNVDYVEENISTSSANVWPFRSSPRRSGSGEIPRTRRRLSSLLLNFNRGSSSAHPSSSLIGDRERRPHDSLNNKYPGQNAYVDNSNFQTESVIDENEDDDDEEEAEEQDEDDNEDDNEDYNADADDIVDASNIPQQHEGQENQDMERQELNVEADLQTASENLGLLGNEQENDDLDTRVWNYLHSSPRRLHESFNDFDDENGRLFNEAASHYLLNSNGLNQGGSASSVRNSWDGRNHVITSTAESAVDAESTEQRQESSSSGFFEFPEAHSSSPIDPRTTFPFSTVEYSTSFYQQSRRLAAESEYRNLVQNLDPQLISQFQTLSSLLDTVAMGTLSRLVNFQNGLFNRPRTNSVGPNDVPTLDDLNNRESNYYGTRVDSLGAGSEHILNTTRMSNNTDVHFGEFMNSLRNENLLARELAGPFVNQDQETMRNHNNIFSNYLNHEPDLSANNSTGTDGSNSERQQIMSFFRAFRFDNARHFEYISSNRQFEDFIPVLIVGVVGTPFRDDDPTRSRRRNRHRHHRHNRSSSETTSDDTPSEGLDSNVPTSNVSDSNITENNFSDPNLPGPHDSIADFESHSIFSQMNDNTANTTIPDFLSNDIGDEASPPPSSPPNITSSPQQSTSSSDYNPTDPANLRSWVIIVMAHHYPASDPVLTSMPLFVDLLFEYAARSSLSDNSNDLPNELRGHRQSFATAQGHMNSFSSDMDMDMTTFRSSLWNFFSEGMQRPYKSRPTKEQLNKKTSNLFTVKINDEVVPGKAKISASKNSYPTRVMNINDTCPICLLDYCNEDIGRELDQCKHIFHKACIDEWLSNGENNCPLCRTRGMEVI